MKTKKQQLGQFFTNPIIANFMSKLAYFDKAKTLLDPAVGEGIFLKHIDLNKTFPLKYVAYDIDNSMITKSSEIISDDVQYKNADYLLSDLDENPDIIICNPPYNKFQEIPNRNEYIETFQKKYNFKISGYSNLCVYFLIKSLFELKHGGKCVYIIPYEFLNTGYGKSIKKFFVETKLLKTIYKFDNNISLFDDALTTSCILVFEKQKHEKVDFVLIKSKDEIETENFKQIKSYLYCELNPEEKWNLYFENETSDEYRNVIDFSKIARAKRGIATGGNAFFALNKEQIELYELSTNVLVKCICKSADIKKPIFSEDDFLKLYQSNKKVFLFDGEQAENQSDYDYIIYGEKHGYHKSYLNSHRNPWYLLEEKQVAPIWISVFNRDKLKIIRNETLSKNLTTFHGIYFLDEYNSEKYINLFFCYLLTPFCQNLLLKSKREYGGGLDKFEPNDLNTAKILDLSIISNEDEVKIIELYNKIKKQENENCSHIIAEIDKIFRVYANK